MGTFVGHIVPGLALIFLGLWHTFNTIKAYTLKGKTTFNSRLWHPFNIPHFLFKHLELFLIFFFSIFAIVMQILDYPLLQFSFKLDNLEHAAMFVHLAIYASFAIAFELTHTPDTFTGLIGVLAASVFGQELFLLHFHSTDHVGLEGHYHWLLQLIVLVSLVSVLMVICFPSNFVSALVLSVSVMFQGCWFINMGFTLWVPMFVPKDCIMRLAEGDNDMLGAITCRTEEASMRARALANLQFSWILAGILIFAACLCLTLAGKSTERSQYSREYEQLHSKGVDAVPISMDVNQMGIVF